MWREPEALTPALMLFDIEVPSLTVLSRTSQGPGPEPSMGFLLKSCVCGRSRI